MLKKRAELSKKEIVEKSRAIQNILFDLEQYKNSNFIFTFISFKNEVDTHELIKKSISMGKRIGVPITIPKERKLMVSEIKDFDKELELGYYNILTPKDECIREVSPKIIDIVLVPGLAFSPKGYRVGYGGGYYDRFFSQNRDIIKIGLCYEMQLSPTVPIDEYDIPIDYIITEKRLIECIREKH